MVTGFEQTTRGNEPGRTLWLKVGANFDFGAVARRRGKA